MQYQVGGGIVIARFGPLISGVLFDGRLSGMNQDIRKVTPRSAGRLGSGGHAFHSPMQVHF